MLGKSIAAFLIVKAFGHSTRTALTISASLAQIGEFSFILAGVGVALGMIDGLARDLILAGAIVSIILNPLLFARVERRNAETDADVDEADAASTDAPQPPRPQGGAVHGHDVLIGYGRVGSFVGRRLLAAGRSVVVVENEQDLIALAKADGARVVAGNGASPAVLARTDIAGAERLYVTIPDAFEAGQIVQQARAQRADLPILSRAHSHEAVAHLERLGSSVTVIGEEEIARRMIEEGRPLRAA
jgi:CPA2 family monovalent cation:H+ antiporter-2